MQRDARIGIRFKLFARAAMATAIIFLPTLRAAAQDVPCGFDDSSLSYRGTPLEQARCLLRPVLTGGHLGAQLKRLPPPLEKLIGKSLSFDRVSLKRYLEEQNISEMDLGGSLSDPLARANTASPHAPFARYFVIHD